MKKHHKHKRVPAMLLKIPNKPFPRELFSNMMTPPETTTPQDTQVEKAKLSGRDLHNLADLATNLWRTRQRLAEGIEKGALTAESKRLLRPIESALENLEELGVRIEDHTGQPFVQGMALNVVSSQPNPALASDRILETLKPTVFFRDQFVQAGDVIIEGPPSSSSGSML